MLQAGRPLRCQWRARAPPHATAPTSQSAACAESALFAACALEQALALQGLGSHGHPAQRSGGTAPLCERALPALRPLSTPPRRAHQHAARPGSGGHVLFWCCRPSCARARGRAPRAPRMQRAGSVLIQNRRARRAFFLVLPPGTGAAARPGGFQPAGRRRSGITTVPCPRAQASAHSPGVHAVRSTDPC